MYVIKELENIKDKFYIKGKGGSQRVIIFNNKSLEVLKFWIGLRNRYKNSAVNEYLFPEGKNYSDLIKQDLADKENLELHLSTIFTELRLKKYIEIRSLDACEWDCHCSGPAFFISHS